MERILCPCAWQAAGNYVPYGRVRPVSLVKPCLLTGNPGWSNRVPSPRLRNIYQWFILLYAGHTMVINRSRILYTDEYIGISKFYRIRQYNFREWRILSVWFSSRLFRRVCVRTVMSNVPWTDHYLDRQILPFWDGHISEAGKSLAGWGCIVANIFQDTQSSQRVALLNAVWRKALLTSMSLILSTPKKTTRQSINITEKMSRQLGIRYDYLRYDLSTTHFIVTTDGHLRDEAQGG